MAEDFVPDYLHIKGNPQVYAFSSHKPMLESLAGVIPMATFSMDDELPDFLNIAYVSPGVCMRDIEDAYVDCRIFAHQMLGVYHGRISSNG